jgi:prenyl protein peptidase
MYGNIIIIRNLLYAPIAEEMIFRGLMFFPLFFAYCINDQNSGKENSASTLWFVLIICPCWFSLAHLHHCIERIRSGVRVFDALLSSLLQATYTLIFGFIAVLLLSRTGSLYSCIVSHIFCNFMGLPDISFMQKPYMKMDPNLIQEGGFICFYPYRYILLLLHGLGLIIFPYYMMVYTKDLAEQSVFWRYYISP